MGIILKSNQNEWLTISHQINNSDYWRGAVYELETAYTEAKKAVTISEHASGIGTLSLSVNRDELELLGENRRRLRSFAQGVHYEISERVDNRFSVQMSDTVSSAYALRPENITVRTGRGSWTSLSALIEPNITDASLRSDFLSRVDSLNSNEKSTELQQAILEAIFWESEFIMARQIQEITEQIFTDEVRAIWEYMTPEERVAFMERFMDESMAVLFADMPVNRTGELAFDASGNGAMRPNGGEGVNVDQIAFNPRFRDDPTGNFSIDAMIRVMVHEVRHAYQWEVRRWIRQDEEIRGPNPLPHIPYSVMEDWGQEYIPPRRPDNWPVGVRWPYTHENYYQQSVEADANGFAGLAKPRENR